MTHWLTRLVAVTSSASTSTLSSSSTIPSTNNSDSNAAAPNPGGKDLSGGAIAGIIIGTGIGLALIGVLWYFYHRRKWRAADLQTSSAEFHDGMHDMYGGTGVGRQDTARAGNSRRQSTSDIVDEKRGGSELAGSLPMYPGDRTSARMEVEGSSPVHPGESTAARAELEA